MVLLVVSPAEECCQPASVDCNELPEIVVLGREVFVLFG